MTEQFWWQRTDLEYINNQLYFAGYDVKRLAQQHQSPAFFYSASRVNDNLNRVSTALNSHGFKNKHKIFYAMKANRFAPLLTYLKTLGISGIDACSPQEVSHAINCGFKPEEISFTACSLSKADLQQLSLNKGLIFNCDSLHSIKSWGKLNPGTEIGIRINPATGTGRAGNDKLQYAGDVVTKFGIYKQQFAEALALASQFNLTVTRIHFHTGCGFLDEQIIAWRKVLKEALWFIEQCPSLSAINVGGGLGVTHCKEDNALDLSLWAGTLQDVFGHLNVKIEVEPGDYIVKDAGILLVEKTFCETKKDKLFMGVNAGFNLAPEPAYYGMPFEPVAIEYNDQLTPVTIVGNINEALDVWYTDLAFPDMTNQDCLAIINCGAYSSSMSSNHCMRGEFKEVLLF